MSAWVSLVAAALISTTVLLAPSIASAATTTTVSASVSDGTAVSAEVGTLTESCNQNTSISARPVDAGNQPDADTYNCTVDQPTATITWGDGTAATTATLVAESQAVEAQNRTAADPALTLPGTPCNQQTQSSSSTCTFAVESTGTPHTYAVPGGYSGHWNWSDTSEGGNGQQAFTATVQNGTMTFNNVHIQRSGNSATLVGTFTYPNSATHYCNFSVSIMWGDGSTTTGTVSQTGSIAVDPACESEEASRSADDVTPAVTGKSFSLGATHSYASSTDPAGDATVSVTYADADTSFNSPGATQQLGTIPAHIPNVTTAPASLDTQTSATLNASVDPQESLVTDCHFDWGPTTAYGSSAPCPTGFSVPNSQITAALTGLTANSTYHYRIVVTTEVGTTTGLDQSFTTLPLPPPGAPVVSTGVASSVMETGATLNASVNPVGGTLSDCHFEYGTSTSYGTSIPCGQASVSGTSNTSVSANITALTGGTTYHYRIVASNPTSAASDGADATFITSPPCGDIPALNYAKASGCFVDQGNVYTSTPGTHVTVNGLTLVPGPSGYITVDENAGVIKSAGEVGVYAAHGSGVDAASIFITEGTISWSVPKAATGVLSESIATITVPQASDQTPGRIDGLPVDGDLAMSFTNSFGASFTGNVYLPFPVWLQQIVGITGTIQFQTKIGTGITSDTETIQKDDWSIFEAVGVKNLKATYDPVTDSWSGSATIEIPTPTPLSIGASLAIVKGQFHSLGASVGGLNIPIGSTIFLQSISFQFGENPTTFGGSIGISFGPKVKDESVAGVTGGFVYKASTSSSPGLIQVNGVLTVGWLKGLNAYFDDYTANGGIRFGAKISPDDDNKYLSFDLSMDGAIQGSKFDLEGKANVQLKYIDVSASADILISDIGFVGCAQLSAAGFSWSPGIGYTWSSGDWDLMAHGCSVGPWQTLTLGQGARAAAAPHAIALLNGSDLVQIDGATGAPQVTLTGPQGQHISVPNSSTKPLLVKGFQVLQDPADKRTWVAIQHGGGRWQITPEAGSTAVTGVRSAQILPAAKASGKVSTAKGGKRMLGWHLSATPGQKVTFWEMGKGVAQIIGSSTKSHGTLVFKPVPGRGGARTIEAHLTLDGAPRANLTIAHFKVAAPPKPAKTKKITVTAGGNGQLKISWIPAANAADYLIDVQVTHGDGAKFIQEVKAPGHKVTIKDANVIKSATVSVTGESLTGLAGKKANAKYTVAKTKKK